MTKKDFELIARALWDANTVPFCDCYDAIVESLATALAQTNPRFDRDRFVAACHNPREN